MVYSLGIDFFQGLPSEIGSWKHREPLSCLSGSWLHSDPSGGCTQSLESSGSLLRPGPRDGKERAGVGQLSAPASVGPKMEPERPMPSQLGLAWTKQQPFGEEGRGVRLAPLLTPCSSPSVQVGKQAPSN